MPDSSSHGSTGPRVATDEHDICAGCGDFAQHFCDGDWYCESCAACDVCQSPYCEDPSHAY